MNILDLIPSQTKLIAYGIAALALAGAAWQVNHWRTEAAQLAVVQKQFDDYKADEARNAKIRQELAENIANQQKINRKLHDDLGKELGNGIYRTCVVPIDGVQIIQRAARPAK